VFVCLFVFFVFFVCLFVCLFVYLLVRVFACLFVCLHTYTHTPNCQVLLCTCSCVYSTGVLAAWVAQNGQIRSLRCTGVIHMRVALEAKEYTMAMSGAGGGGHGQEQPRHGTHPPTRARTYAQLYVRIVCLHNHACKHIHTKAVHPP